MSEPQVVERFTVTDRRRQEAVEDTAIPVPAPAAEPEPTAKRYTAVNINVPQNIYKLLDEVFEKSKASPAINPKAEDFNDFFLAMTLQGANIIRQIMEQAEKRLVTAVDGPLPPPPMRDGRYVGRRT